MTTAAEYVAWFERDPLHRVSHVELAEVLGDTITRVRCDTYNVCQSGSPQWQIKQVIRAVAELHRQIDIANEEHAIRRTEASIRVSKDELREHREKLAELKGDTDG